MKKLLMSSLLLSSFIAKANTDFLCQEKYDAKIAKMEKNKTVRKIVKGGITGVVGLTAGVVIVASSGTFLPLGVAVFGTMAGVGMGMPVYWGVDSIDREDGIRDAYEVQQMLLIPYSEIVGVIEAEREELIKKLLAEFNSRITHPDYLQRLVLETNRERLDIGLPALSSDEVVHFQQEKIALEVRGQKLEVVNGISESLKMAKKKGAVSQDMTYDNWRELLNANQGVFCSSGKPKTTRGATLDLIKSLKSDDSLNCEF